MTLSGGTLTDADHYAEGRSIRRAGAQVFPQTVDSNRFCHGFPNLASGFISPASTADFAVGLPPPRCAHPITADRSDTSTLRGSLPAGVQGPKRHPPFHGGGGIQLASSVSG